MSSYSNLTLWSESAKIATLGMRVAKFLGRPIITGANGEHWWDTFSDVMDKIEAQLDTEVSPLFDARQMVQDICDLPSWNLSIVARRDIAQKIVLDIVRPQVLRFNRTIYKMAERQHEQVDELKDMVDNFDMAVYEGVWTQVIRVEKMEAFIEKHWPTGDSDAQHTPT